MIQAHFHESTPRIQGRSEFRCYQRHPVCVSCICPRQGFPRSICWASTISRTLQPRGTLHARADLHFMACLSGMTAKAPDTATVLVNRVFRHHVATGAECSAICHGAAFRLSPFAPWANGARGRLDFPSAQPDLQLASRRIHYPYRCGWLAVLACQFPTRAAHGQAR